MSTTVDLRTGYLGLTLRTPLVASSSPLTADVGGLRSLEDHGASAVVLPSLFEEQINFESMEVDRMLSSGSESFAESLSYFPDMEDYNTGPDHYLDLVTDAKEALSIPVIGSLNGSSPGGWVEHARLIEEAGADALELNTYSVAADGREDSASIEKRLIDLVSMVKSEVSIPLAVKLGPHYTALAHLAPRIVKAGADGLVLFNRFSQPDLDLDTLDVVPRMSLSTSEELRLPLRWIAILHGRFAASLAATTGVHTSADVLKLLLAGADVAMMASALLQYGAEHIARIEAQMVTWLEEHEYESVEQLKGSVSQRAVPDPDAYERANYMRTLRSYSSRFHH